jgi:shikimate dehydrogenase
MKKLVSVGDPIEHSLSPVMHNAALKELELDKDYFYDKLLVKSYELGNFVESLKSGEIFGASITSPHKVEIIPLLDNLTSEAETIGAVNMIYLEEGSLIGHNTDGIGCLNALKENGVDVDKKKIVILGAGGASRAIAFTLKENGANIVILNRTVEKAESLASNVGCEGYGLDKLKELAFDVLINTTTIGMNAEKSLVDPNLLNPSIVVMDIIYNPIKTNLIKDAESKGCKTIKGVGMLVHQGAESFKIWTGYDAPIEVMKEAVIKSLSKK